MRAVTLNGKSLQATELQSGDIRLDGYCVVYERIDADGENFLRNSLKTAGPAFLRGPAPLAWHHDASKILGRVLSLEEDAYGVKMVGRVDRQSPESPLHYLYETIRRGSGKVGLSIGGYFSRAATATGRMIDNVLRITEISATARASHPLTLATVEETKAIMSASGDRRAIIGAAGHDLAMLRIQAAALNARLARSAALTAQARLSI